MICLVLGLIVAAMGSFYLYGRGDFLLGGMIGLLTLGWRLRGLRPGYAVALQGGGIGVMHLTLFAAARLFHMVPLALGFAVMLGLVVFSGLLAVMQLAPAMAVLGAAVRLRPERNRPPAGPARRTARRRHRNERAHENRVAGAAGGIGLFGGHHLVSDAIALPRPLKRYLRLRQLDSGPAVPLASIDGRIHQEGRLPVRAFLQFDGTPGSGGHVLAAGAADGAYGIVFSVFLLTFTARS